MGMNKKRRSAAMDCTPHTTLELQSNLQRTPGISIWTSIANEVHFRKSVRHFCRILGNIQYYGSRHIEWVKLKYATHARRGYKKSCKFWLELTIEQDEKKKEEFTPKELREMEKLIHQHREMLLEQLDIFQGKPVTAIRL